VATGEELLVSLAGEREVSVQTETHAVGLEDGEDPQTEQVSINVNLVEDVEVVEFSVSGEKCVVNFCFGCSGRQGGRRCEWRGVETKRK
jgi:hypothetical protein